jgi:hypothetical protein
MVLDGETRRMSMVALDRQLVRLEIEQLRAVLQLLAGAVRAGARRSQHAPATHP